MIVFDMSDMKETSSDKDINIRVKAIKWYNDMDSNRMRKYVMLMYPKRICASLTGREIELLYRAFGNR